METEKDFQFKNEESEIARKRQGKSVTRCKRTITWSISYII